VFGFYIANLINETRKKQTSVVESLREEGGSIEAMYCIIKNSLPKSETEKVQMAIDNYLMASMDYSIADYSYSSVEFDEMFSYILNVRPENKKQESALDKAIGILTDISKNRSRIETLVKERVSLFEWVTACSLLALVLFFVFSVNNGELISIIITSLIAATLTMLPIIVRSLDSLRWKEDKWFWEPIEELFIGLDLVPYYDRGLVDEGRLIPKEGQPIRLAEYPHPYPDMSDKVVTLYQ
jgi:hypothetical protein